MKPFPISDLPPALQAQARAQLSGAGLLDTMREIAAPGRSSPPAPTKTKAPARIRQNAAGLNKTEQAFADYLAELSRKAEHERGTEAAEPFDVLPPQSLTLRLANGCRYTPDFVTVRNEPIEDGAGYAQTLHAYEVKGFMRDDAAVKIKVAAALFPWISFHLVTRAKGGTWEILPVLA